MRTFKVGFDPKAHGGMWVWWVDTSMNRMLNQRHPKVMVRDATPEEAEIMDRLEPIIYPSTDQDKQDADKLLKLIGND